jgi:hypothetical protein
MAKPRRLQRKSGTIRLCAREHLRLGIQDGGGGGGRSFKGYVESVTYRLYIAINPIIDTAAADHCTLLHAGGTLPSSHVIDLRDETSARGGLSGDHQDQGKRGSREK